MLNDRAVRGTHFTCLHAGPMDGWAQFRLDPPDVPLPAKGKLFLRNLLGSAGLEMSLNMVPPGKAMPFLHRHQQNEEVYVVVGGRGQFLVDGEGIDVAEGSVLRISPPAARAWRNNSDAPLDFLCLHHRADSVIRGGTLDGQRVEGKPAWAD
jgi:mannose-6-phosphate isomerase-like protein (cupin superfamily)